jgi:hypothetical protein
VCIDIHNRRPDYINVERCDITIML